MTLKGSTDRSSKDAKPGEGDKGQWEASCPHRGAVPERRRPFWEKGPAGVAMLPTAL